MKHTCGVATAGFAKRTSQIGKAVAMVLLLSCEPEVIGPRIATQLILATSAAGAVNGQPFATPPTVHVADDDGEPLDGANFPVVLTVSDGATLTGPTTVNAIDGVAIFNATGLTGPAGTYTLTFTATLAVGPRTVTQSVTLAPGAASTYIVSSSAGNPEVGTPVTITAQLVDSHNSPISASGRTVTWSVSGQNGSFGAATSQTNASGRATVTYTVDTIDGKTATITATDNSSISGSTTLTSVSGPAARLAFNVQPSNTGVGTVSHPPVVVTIQDRYGNTVTAGAPAVTLSIAANPGGATISGGGPTAASGGIATFAQVMLDQPASGYTLSASSPGLTSATSGTFDVSAISILAKVPASRSLTVSGSTVYFTDCSAPPGVVAPCNVASVATTGGAVPPSAGSNTLFADFGGRLLVDGTHLNFLRVNINNLRTRFSSAIVRGALVAGETGSTLSVPSNTAAHGPDLEADGTHFYTNWSQAPDFTSGIGRTRISDGVTQILASNFSPFAIAGGQLYYQDVSVPGTIQKKSVDGGASTIAVTGAGSLGGQGYPSRRMLVVDNEVFWVESGGLLRSAATSGGVATTRATGLSGNLVSDGTYLYAAGTDAIRRFRLSDFSEVTIATNEAVIDIAIDQNFVYWATRDGYIKKAPR